ncbi:glycosyltransferase family 8 protein [Aspergillus mulundensis]|uniref:Glycosyl transferase family protein n=1 Tax=Aspergillus mulundensis TaxID=1810919 RepID=A0A3D8RQN8_9EURO|nr:hypothetical protein DSM5745_06375 [Aspergillus mulundensis]RDW76383.1 hypothetical protein DSM5745_06375 [Aspergillus mulundensis]
MSSNTSTSPSSSNTSKPNSNSTPKKVWTTLITNTSYLPGLLTLEFSLRRVNSAYPLVALYTDSLPASGHAALDARGIAKKHVPYLLPSIHKEYTNDVRFYDCWSKLTPFSLVEYDRVVQLDCDMLVLRNMDELMEVELDGFELKGEGRRVFAACHACVCNPLRKEHYPVDWCVRLLASLIESQVKSSQVKSNILTENARIPSNCAYTTQHTLTQPIFASNFAPPASSGLGIPNGGLQVVNPCLEIYNKITAQLGSAATSSYDFADQSLLGDLFRDRWVALPYVYNALKTLRWEGVHDVIWEDGEVKNVHYILSPKPWEEMGSRNEREGQGQNGDGALERKGKGRDPLHAWWWEVNRERLNEEKAKGIDDGF